MWPRGRVRQSVMCCVSLVVLNAFALTRDAIGQQLGVTANIIGQVTDDSGGVLPGVTVTAMSPALQLESVTVVTDVNGEYRLTPLPVGLYAVEYTLSGFQALRREGIRLTVGFTARLDVVLRVGQMEESVTVTGQAPLIDTRAAGTATQILREALETIPTGRNGYIGLMQQTPGARPPLDVGGSSANQNPSFRAFGQAGQAWQLVDGVMTSNPRIGDSGNYFDFTAFEEATVETVGHDASIGARGVAVNTVIKSGGNDFHGGLFFGGTSSTLEASPEGGEGGNLNRRVDVNGEIGGRIIRDKLWFWYGSRFQQNQQNVLDCLKPDGSLCTTTNTASFFTPKVTYQLNPSHRFSSFFMWDHRDDVEQASALIPWESRRHQTSEWRIPTNGAGKIDWTGIRGQSLTWNVMWGYFFNKSGSFADEDNFNLIHRRDRTTGRRSGLNDRAGERTGEGRTHVKAVASYFARQGNSTHDLRLGADYFLVHGNRTNIGRGPAKNYRLDYRDNFTQADRIFVWNYPNTPNINIRYLGAYVSDDWTINRRLTLNLGLRYVYDNGFEGDFCREAAVGAPNAIVYPAECFEKIQMPIFKTVSPRLRFVYDVVGDARSVLKGGWGRYHRTRETDDLFMIARSSVGSTSFRWRDLNGNSDWDPGESDLDVNGPDFLAREQSGATGGLQNAVINPDEKAPKTDEFMLQYEQQLATGFAMRVTGIYSLATDQYRLLNTLRPPEAFNIPMTNADPGPDGLVGTADDPGTFITVFDYADELAGLDFQRPTLFNDPAADRSYTSVEFAASRRLANNWQFQASYSATRIDEPFPTAYEDALMNPNHEIFAGNQTWEWGARASGSYLFPYGILVSSNFEHRSGDPWARTFEFEVGGNVESVETRVEPLGARRLPHINLLAVRIQKALSLGGSRELQLRVNAYNLLNTNVVTEIQPLSGPTFGLELSRVLPRIVDFQVQYRF